jgi:hypothetical protein
MAVGAGAGALFRPCVCFGQRDLAEVEWRLTGSQNPHPVPLGAGQGWGTLFSAANGRMLFRKMRRDTVFIFGSGKVSPVGHGDARAGADGFNTDDVIGVDISILRRSFDEYEFGQGLPSRLNRIRGEISAHNGVIGWMAFYIHSLQEQHATGCRTSAADCGYCVG